MLTVSRIDGSDVFEHLAAQHIVDRQLHALGVL
jgi:hypothetical protein